MKAKSLIFLLVTTVMIIINIVFVTQVKKTENQVLKVDKYFEINENYFSFSIPSFFQGPKIKTNNGWNIKNYYLGNSATFRVSTLTSVNPNFDELCKQYFHLKSIDKSHSISKTNKGLVFYKKINLIENGLYVIRKEGKKVSYIYFFTINDNLYWLDFFPKSSFISYKTIFDNILSTIKFKNGTSIPKNFTDNTKSICFESYFLFCQPYEIIIVLPIFILIFVWIILTFISKKLGATPSIETLAELNPSYTEENVEIETMLRNKKSFSTCFIAINSSYLYVFKFKKEFLTVPIRNYNFNFEEKTGLFGRKYIQFELQNAEHYKTKRFYYNKPHKIRIYSNSTSSIMSYL